MKELVTQLSVEKRFELMENAIDIVEKRIKETGYSKYIPTEELCEMVVEEFHNLVKTLLYNKANQIA